MRATGLNRPHRRDDNRKATRRIAPGGLFLFAGVRGGVKEILVLKGQG